MGWFESHVTQPISNAAHSVGQAIDDAILQPVVHTVDAIVSDPRKLAMVAVAVLAPGAGAALGSAMGLSGAAATIAGNTAINTLLNGGDVKAALITSGVSFAASSIGSSIASNVRADAIMNGDMSFVDANTVGKMAGAAGAGMASTALLAAATGKPITLDGLLKNGLTAGLTSGVSSAVDKVTSSIETFGNLSQPTQRAIKAAVASGIMGKNVPQAVLNSVLSSVYKDSQASNFINGKLQDVSRSVLDSQKLAQQAQSTLQQNQSDQQAKIDDYNKLVTDLTNKYDKAVASNSNDDIISYNNAATSYGPTLTKYKDELDDLQGRATSLSDDFNTKYAKFQTSIDNFQNSEDKNAKYISDLISNSATTGADGQPLTQNQILSNVYKKLSDDYIQDKQSAADQAEALLSNAQHQKVGGVSIFGNVIGGQIDQAAVDAFQNRFDAAKKALDDAQTSPSIYQAKAKLYDAGWSSDEVEKQNFYLGAYNNDLDKLAKSKGFPSGDDYVKYHGDIDQASKDAGFPNKAAYQAYSGDIDRLAKDAGFPSSDDYVKYHGNLNAFAKGAGFADIGSYNYYGGDLDKLATAKGFPDAAAYTKYDGDLNAAAKDTGFPDANNYKLFKGDVDAAAKQFGFPDADTFSKYKGDVSLAAKDAGFPSGFAYRQYHGDLQNYSAGVQYSKLNDADKHFVDIAVATGTKLSDAVAYAKANPTVSGGDDNTGTQVASSDGGLPSGSLPSGPRTMDISGVPIYADSKDAYKVKPPLGYDLMPMSMSDSRPDGAYYDTTQNAWFMPNQDAQKLNGALVNHEPTGGLPATPGGGATTTANTVDATSGGGTGPGGLPTLKAIGSLPGMQPRDGETAGKVDAHTEDGVTTYTRTMTYTKPDGTDGSYTINYDPNAKEGKQFNYGTWSTLGDSPIDTSQVTTGIVWNRPDITATNKTDSGNTGDGTEININVPVDNKPGGGLPATPGGGTTTTPITGGTTPEGALPTTPVDVTTPTTKVDEIGPGSGLPYTGLPTTSGASKSPTTSSSDNDFGGALPTTPVNNTKPTTTTDGNTTPTTTSGGGATTPVDVTLPGVGVVPGVITTPATGTANTVDNTTVGALPTTTTTTPGGSTTPVDVTLPGVGVVPGAITTPGTATTTGTGATPGAGTTTTVDNTTGGGLPTTTGGGTTPGSDITPGGSTPGTGTTPGTNPGDGTTPGATTPVTTNPGTTTPGTTPTTTPTTNSTTTPTTNPTTTPVVTMPGTSPSGASKTNPFGVLPLDSSAQMLTSTIPQLSVAKMAGLHQLFNSLTPEMQSVLSDRGITPPTEASMPEMTQAASGGLISDETSKILDSLNPKFTSSPTLLPSVAPKEQEYRLGSLRHLAQGPLKGSTLSNRMASGGLPHKYAEAAPEGHKPEFITGLTGYYAQGGGTGQSDDIPAMLHDGDWVCDADMVAALGDGSSKAGAEVLDKMLKQIPHRDGAAGSPVPAKIADGEFVFPAAFVTAIGGGSNKLGAERLNEMREKIRAHKRSAPTTKIPPKAKSPLDYLKMAKG